MDPLSAAEHANGRPTSWVGFDEISMTSPVNGRTTSSGQPQGARPGSVDPYDGRNSVATEERLELEDNERTVITPLPTKEVIAGGFALRALVLDPARSARELCISFVRVRKWDFFLYDNAESSFLCKIIDSGG